MENVIFVRFVEQIRIETNLNIYNSQIREIYPQHLIRARYQNIGLRLVVNNG